MRAWLIERLGGYPTVDAALEAARGMPLVERHKVLTLAVKRLFNTIGEDDILKVHPGNQWLFEGRTLPKGQVDLLKAEATTFLGSFLWKVLQREVRYHSNKAMYLKSQDLVDIAVGKMLAYYADIIETKLKRMVNPDN